MTTLLYSPEYDHIWLGCTFAEVENHFMEAMEKETILRYLDMKKEWFSERHQQHNSNIMDIYGIDFVPQMFMMVSRDLKTCYPEEPYYPMSAMVPPEVFQECDHIVLDHPGQLRKLVMTANGGEPIAGPHNSFPKRKLYFDMDGTIVNFESGMRQVSPNILDQYWDHPEDIEGIFALMEPMEGAIEAVNILTDYYDCYILSTAPWDNPGAWADKVRWLQKYFGQTFYKKVILTHCKELLSDGESYLIDDRKAHGADAFGDRLVSFKPQTMSLAEVANYMKGLAEDEGVGIKY